MGYNASKWKADLTYNTADKTITTLGGTVSTSTKAAATFETKTFDITDALKDDDDKVVTILIYETAAAGGFVKNPQVTLTYRPTPGTAEQTTLFDFEDGTHPFKNFDALRMTISVEDNADLASKVLKNTCGNMNEVAFTYYDFTELSEKAKMVEIDFDFNIASVSGHELISIADAAYHTGTDGGFADQSNTGYGSKGAIFNLGCYRASGANKFGVNSKQTSLDVLGKWCHAKVIVDVAAKKVSYVISEGTEELLKAENQDYLNADAVKCTQIDTYIGTKEDGNAIRIDNLSIKTTVAVGAAYADYDVVFYDETLGKEIARETRNDEVGLSVALQPTDKQPFFNDDESIRYLYASDDAASVTITEDVKAEVTIKFRHAEKWAYMVSTSYDATPLSYTIDGWCWEDLNSFAVRYPRYQVAGKQLVTKDPNNNNLQETVTIAKDGDQKNMDYKAVEGIDNVYLLAEAEQLGTSLSTSGTSFNTRVSGGSIVFGASGTLITLPAGKYKFTLGVIGKPNNSDVAYTVSAGATEIIASFNSGGNTLTTKTSDEFQLTEPTPVTFTCSSPSSDRGIDLIYIQKTDDLPESIDVEVSEAGFATLASDYALDLSGVSGVYTAKLDGAVVTFEEAAERVLPGTGLLVKAEKGTLTLPVVAEAKAVSNALVGVLSTTEVSAGIFVLMNGSQGVGFYKTANTFSVRAHSAYLPASIEGARTFIALGDETTGVQAPDAMQGRQPQQEAIFNLQGQRVAQPRKGLYLQNGRKAIFK